MWTIKLDKDEMLKIAGELSALKEEINVASIYQL